jgi:4,5-dihydroxyphthalate decarboxylase
VAKSLVSLNLAVADYPHTQAIVSGRIPIEGVATNFVKIEPQIAAYRRMVRNLEFDVCEIAPTTYIMARALGAPFVALPIFVARGFHHGGLLVRPDANIRIPKDLEGKKVGVRAYSVTTGVWTRGILIDEYGLDSSKVTWVVDDEEHVQELKLPPNVVQAPEGISLVEMMAKGEISAGFSGNAGLGRAGKPTGNWDAKNIPPASYPDLFPKAKAIEAAWHKKTGIYPMHGTIVVKESVLQAHPWVAQSLFKAYSAAKAEWLSDLAWDKAASTTDMKYRELTSIVGPDPLPYGMAANRPTIEALESYTFKQGLTRRRMRIPELFVDPERA